MVSDVAEGVAVNVIPGVGLRVGRGALSLDLRPSTERMMRFRPGYGITGLGVSESITLSTPGSRPDMSDLGYRQTGGIIVDWLLGLPAGQHPPYWDPCFRAPLTRFG